MSDTPAQERKPEQTQSHHSRPDSQDATSVPTGPSPPETPLPETIGGYTVLAKLGEGGMGTVYRSHDTQLEREVALKVMRPEVAAHPVAKERFLREARAMAALHDDHIVTVHQVGSEVGVPFLAMELLEGKSLHDRVREVESLDWPSITRIGRDIALGLAVAHAKGVIHRDIKPANIWLEGARERVKILDFGLARPVVEENHLTADGAIVGTPSYMAPEQARGRALDGRADLFSLGVLLYRLSAGRLPFHGETLIALLTSLAVDEPNHVSSARAGVPPKLAGLIHRLLAKEPAGRPASAQATAAELDTILGELRSAAQITAPSTAAVAASATARVEPAPSAMAAEAVSSTPTPPRRRHQWWVAAGFATFLALVVGGVIIATKFQGGKETKIKEPDGSHVKLGADDTVAEESPKNIDPPPKESRPHVSRNPVMVKPGEPFNFQTFVSRPAPIPGIRTWTIETVAHSDYWEDVMGFSCAWSADGLFIATGGYRDKSIRIWDRQGRLQKILLGHKREVNAVTFSPDAKLLASAGTDGVVRFWDVATGACSKEILLSMESNWVRHIAFSPQGDRLAAENYKSLSVFDLTTGKRVCRNIDTQFNSPSWSPDGSRIAVVTGNDKVTILNAATLEPEYELELPGREKIDFAATDWSNDGKWVAARSQAGVIHVWNTKTRELKQTLGSKHGQSSGWTAVKWSKDSRRLLSADQETAFAVWDAIDGKLVLTSEIQDYGSSIAWSPDESEFAVITGRLRIFETRTGKELRSAVVPSAAFATRVTLKPIIADDKTHLVCSGDVSFNSETGYENIRFQNKIVGGTPIYPSPQGNRCAILSEPNNEIPRPHMILIDLPPRKSNKVLDPGDKESFRLDWSPDGRWMATAHKDGAIRIWDGESLKLIQELKGHAGEVCEAYWSPTGKRIASLDEDQILRIWDPFEAKCLQSFKEFPADLGPLASRDYQPRFAWGKNDQSLAVAFSSFLVAELDFETGKWSDKGFQGNGGLFRSHDGKTVVITGDEGNVMVRGADPKDRFAAMSGFRHRHIDWLPDSRRFYSRNWPHFGYDVKSRQRLGTFMLDVRGEAFVIGPDGHYRGNAEVEKHIVYVAQLEDGSNITLSPAEFAKRFGWKNDPGKARFLKLDE